MVRGYMVRRHILRQHIGASQHKSVWAAGHSNGHCSDEQCSYTSIPLLYYLFHSCISNAMFSYRDHLRSSFLL